MTTWQERFDKFVLERGSSDNQYVQLNYDALKVFIKTELSDQLEELKAEVEGMKLEQRADIPSEEYCSTYNAALIKVLDLIERKK